MYGWRARIGYVSPCPVDSSALNFYSIAPLGVVMVCTNLSVHNIEEKLLNSAESLIVREVQALANDEVDYIVLGGEPVVFLAGYGRLGYWEELVKTITDIPMTTNVGAVIDAMRELQIKKPAVLVPYKVQGEDGCDQTGRLKTFLEDAGFQVAGFRSLGFASNLEISRQPHYLSYREAKRLIREYPEADGLYIPCARWGAVDHIERLEQDLGIPVVTSVQSWMWKTFRDLGIRDEIRGYGKLLASHR